MRNPDWSHPQQPHNLWGSGVVATARWTTAFSFPCLQDSRQLSVKKCLSLRPHVRNPDEVYWGRKGTVSFSPHPPGCSFSSRNIAPTSQHTIPLCIPHARCWLSLKSHTGGCKCTAQVTCKRNLSLSLFLSPPPCLSLFPTLCFDFSSRECNTVTC